MDADVSLTPSSNSVIADFEDADETTADRSNEEEENKGKMDSPNEDLGGEENNDGEPIVAPEGEGSNQDQLEVP